MTPGGEAVAAHPGTGVLVRLPNWLGDVLLARPLLHALKRAQPAPRKFGVGPAALLELLAPEALFEAAAPWARDGAGRRACLGRAREFGPDTALVLPPSFSSAWFAYRSGARRRIGYAADGRSALLSTALPRPARGDRHLSGEYLEIGRRAGLLPDAAAPAMPPDLAIPGAAAASAEALLAGHPATAGRPRAILGPGAIYGPAKQWGAARFAELGKVLAARGHAVLVCGTAAEAALCAEVARAAGEGAVSLAGRTGLAELAALCASSSVAVCNDSGLAHLAAATGAATVVVFGSTSSAWTAPVGRRVRIVQRAPVCAPCFRRTCRIGYACLEAVTVDAVLGASLELAA